jgi:hypothetical protein
MEEAQKRKKPDLKTKRPTQKTTLIYLSSAASQPNQGEDLLGMEGVKHREWVGAFGVAAPAQ